MKRKTALFLACLGAGLYLPCPAYHARAEAISAEGSTSARGEQIYRETCAACHENDPASRAPARATLGLMAPESVYRALSGGMMAQIGVGMADADRRAVASYVTAKPFGQAAAPVLRCAAGHSRFDWSRPPVFSNWGIDEGNNHFIESEKAGIGRATVRNLRLKWALAFPGAVRARSQPALAGGAIFVGSHDGTVFALDQETGCARWTFQARAEVRTGIVISGWTAGSRRVRPTLYFGDLIGNIYAVDAVTGRQKWSRKMDDHPAATITAAPTLYDGRLYVAVSSLEEATRSPLFACCTFRGSVVALDARDGKQLWQTFMTAPPQQTGVTPEGVKMFGPSGAAIWNTPTIDAARRSLYFGTGDNYSEPHNGLSDAIVALDMDSGRIKWVTQTVAGDIWPGDGPDSDWGAPPALVRKPDGKDILVAGQKSAVVFGFDPDTGKPLWQTRVGRGGIGGGVQFGIAVAGTTAFVPIHDRADGRTYPEPRQPGIYAVDVRDGARLWSAPLADACEGRTACYPGYAGAITATPELVLAGAIDGFVRAYDARSGAVLWSWDTTQPVRTVNGQMAQGGSIAGGSAPIAQDGLLLVNSGYAAFNSTQKAGNVFLVFEVEDRRRTRLGNGR